MSNHKLRLKKIESLKKAINKLQEELTVQKTITDAVSERNLKLKAEMEALIKGQSVLEKKMDQMTMMFRTTFEDLIKASAETIVAHVKKTGTRKKKEKPKDSGSKLYRFFFAHNLQPVIECVYKQVCVYEQ
jgi:seryl-tRNA synthetase